MARSGMLGAAGLAWLIPCLIAAMALAPPFTPPAAAQTASCARALKQLDDAIATRDRAALEREGFDIGGVPGCDPDAVRAKRRQAALILVDLARPSQGAEARERYRRARRVAAVWPVVQGLAEAAHAERNWPEAAKLYSDLLVAMRDPERDDPPVPETVIALAEQRAGETQMLVPPEAAPLPHTRAGAPGGLDAVLVEGAFRDLIPRPRLMPVTFESNGARMTPSGSAFAERWWQSVRASVAPALVLAGHSDPRGNPARNEVLSLQRAAALGEFLKAKGFTGTVTVVGYGQRCLKPFSPGSSYTAEEQWQIQRRVEILANAAVPAGYCRGMKPTMEQ